METLKFKNMTRAILANYEFDSIHDEAAFVNILEDIYVKNIYNKLNESSNLEELKETMKSILFSEIQYNGELKKLIKNEVDIESEYSKLTNMVLEAIDFNKEDYTETFYNNVYEGINKELKDAFKDNEFYVPQVIKNVRIGKNNSISAIVDTINILNKNQHWNMSYLTHIIDSEKYDYLKRLKEDKYEPFLCKQCKDTLENNDYIIINHDNMKDEFGEPYKLCSIHCAYEYIENNNIDIY